MEGSWSRRGGPRNRSVSDRFWEKVEKTPDCWIWRGARNRQGYGVLQVNGKAVRVNRLVFDLIGQPLAPGEHSLHHCDNPPCVRPDHLFRGGFAENMADMAAKGRAAHRPLADEDVARLMAGRLDWQSTHRRTECMKGHAFTPENTIITANGKRRCRACGRANVSATARRRMLDPERRAHRLARQREYEARYRERRAAP